jgi:hypothetical protein
MAASASERRAALIAALGFLRVRPEPPEVGLLRCWLDSWAGVGAVVDGMVRQGFDVALTRNGEAGWRVLFYPSSFIHESRAGSAWGTTPWQAVQSAAWETLRRPSRG